MKYIILFFALFFCTATAFTQKKILFDNTKNEQAGNADWVIDDGVNQLPSPAQSGITGNPFPIPSGVVDTYWSGGLSMFGIEMVKQGFTVETLPETGQITFGDATNSQDLFNYDVFVLCEPNNPFTAAEKTAILNFVRNGGGLFMIADHDIADRDFDGWSACDVLNDLMATDPFGMQFSLTDDFTNAPSTNMAVLPGDPLLYGLAGDVNGLEFHGGTSITINTATNPTVKAVAYKTGASNTGTTGALAAYATYGNGKVVGLGDSSAAEDQTPNGGTTYPGWIQPIEANGAPAGTDMDNGRFCTNAMLWLSSPLSAVMTIIFDTNLSAGTTITLPLNSIGGNVIVDWGDSNIETFTTNGDKNHTYTSGGVYVVAISGTLFNFGKGAGTYANANKIVRVTSFGNIGLKSLAGAFSNAANLVEVPPTIPVGITNLSYTFKNASIFNYDISAWDVSQVTSMEQTFCGANLFNQNIGNWNVANVTTMSSMFACFIGYAAFNQYIGNWNVTKVTNMRQMFFNASSFNQNISSWNVGNVTNMSYMFKSAAAFNQNIGGWNVENVTDMSYMFWYAAAFNQNIATWNVSKVTTMTSMFGSATAFNQNIGGWNVGSVTDMSSMFSSATSFNQPIGSWNVINVTTMRGMFFYAPNFNQNISAWNTENVTDMSTMFCNAVVFNQNISTWNVGKVTTMYSMFYEAKAFIQNIGSWNVSKVTDFSNMFFGATVFNGQIGTWDVSSAIDMRSMFQVANSFNQNLSNWNVANVTNMNSMFKCFSFNQNIGNWNVGNVTDMTDMFMSATLSVANYDAILIGWAAQTLKPNVNFYVGSFSKYSCGAPETARAVLTGAANNWTITDGGVICEPMTLVYNTALGNATNTITIPLNGIVNVSVDWGDANIQSVTAAGNLSHTYSAAGIYTVKISGELTWFGNDNGNINADKLFRVLNFGNIGLNNLSYAFYNATNLIEVPTTFPSAVTDMSYMFYNASNFNYNISSWNTENVTNMDRTFALCTLFNQNIGSWNVSKVTDMSAMFVRALAFNQNIGAWNVGSVTTMIGMFNEAVAFNQNIGNWNVSNVIEMSDMFSGATAFNQNISGWNVQNVVNMAAMFNEAISFNQNLGGWSISNVVDMFNMFYGVTLSTTNYDAILIGWASQTLQPTVDFHGGNSKYSCGAATTARAVITNNNNWTITDGGSIACATVWVGPEPAHWTNGAPNATIDATIDWLYNEQINIECKNLLINATRNLEIQPEFYVTINGSLTNNGAIILKSHNNMLPSGSLITLGTITNNGTMRAERYITPNRYHFMSSPLNANVNATIPFALDYVWTYNEDYNGIENDDAWNRLPVTGATIDPEVGYLVKSTTDFNSNFVISFAGEFNTGTVDYGTLPTAYQGYNLVANPYPSAIDWNAASGWTKNNIATSTWIWKSDGVTQYSGNYATWNGTTGVNGGSRYIAAMQGFFVKATPTNNLQMNNNVRVHNAVNFKSEVADLLKLTIAGNNFNDEIAIYFDDNNQDSEKFLSWTENMPQIYTIENNNKLAINKLQNIEAKQSVKMGIVCDISGNYTIRANEFTFNELYNIVLEDTKTSTFKTITQDAVYSFRYEKGEPEARFVLHFNYSQEDIENKDINIYAYAKNIYFNNIENLSGTINVYNVLGKVVLCSDLKSVVQTNLVSGVYMVEVVTDGHRIVNRVLIK